MEDITVTQTKDTVDVATSASQSKLNPPPTQDFNLHVEGGINTAIQQLTERDYMLGSYRFNTTDTVGRIVHQFDVPDVLFEQAGIPNVATLGNYALWHTDIQVKVTVSAPKSCHGILNVSYCHGLKEMDTDEIDRRTSMKSFVQQNSARVHVNSPDEVVLDIPYDSFKSYGVVDKDSRYADNRKMATVFISVLSPLYDVHSIVNSASVIVNVRFVNFKTSGLIFKPQAGMILASTNPLTMASETDCFDDLGFSSFSGKNGGMSMDTLKVRPGYYDHFDWTGNNTLGHILWSANVDPTFDIVGSAEGRYPLDVAPPVSILASMAQMWSGSLNYTFVVPNCIYLRGTILVSFIPTCDKADQITLDQMKCCYNVRFDLGTANEFTMKVPYISDVPVRKLQSGLSSIGTLKVAVVSPLSSSDGLSRLRINVMLSGGDDFKLYSCRPSVYGTFYNSFKDVAVTYPFFNQGYLGKDLNIAGGSIYVFRRSVLDNDLTIFNVEPGAVYRPRTAFTVEINGTKKKITAFGTPYIDGVPSDIYLSPLRESTGIRSYLDNEDNSGFVQYVSDTDYMTIPDFEIFPQPESGIQVSVSSSRPVVAHVRELTTKEICARFNHAGSAVAPISEDILPGADVFIIPVRPEGTHITVNESRVLTRDGNISVLASGFKYFAGDLRYKLCFHNYPAGQEVNVMFDASIISTINLIKTGSGLDPFSVVDNSLPMITRNLSLNNIVDVKIPFSINCEQLSLNSVDIIESTNDLLASRFNGAIRVSCNNNLEENYDLRVSVYFAFCDNANFYNFIGFAPVMDVTDVETLQPSLFKSVKFNKPTPSTVIRRKVINASRSTLSAESSYLSSFASSMLPGEVSAGINRMNEHAERISNDISNVSNNISTVAENTNRVSGKVEVLIDSANNLMNGFTKGVQDVKETLLLQNIPEEAIEKITGVLMNVGHLLFSSHPGTVVLVFVQILRELGFKAVTSSCKIVEALYDLFVKLCRPLQTPEDGAPVTESGCQFSENDIAVGLTGLVIGGYLLVGQQKPDKAVAYGKYLMHTMFSEFKTIAVAGISIISFLKVILPTLFKVFSFVRCKYLGIKEDNALTLLNSADAIKNWAHLSRKALDPLNRESIKTSPEKIVEVTILKMYGEALLSASVVDSPSARGAVHVIRDLMKELVEFNEEIANECLAPSVKFEPFVLTIAGPPKTGKSRFMHKLTAPFLKTVGLKSRDPVYTRTSGVEYHNRFFGQPIWHFDDFGQATDPESVKTWIMEKFQIKGTNPVNANCANLADKNRLINNIIAVESTNLAYYYGCIEKFCADPTAFHRRRDLLIHMSPKEKYLDEDKLLDISKVPADVLANNEHVTFKIYKSVITDQGFIKDGVNDKVFTYQEMIDEIMVRWKEYYAKHSVDYRQRIEDMYEYMPKTASLCEDFDGFRKTMLDFMIDWASKEHKIEVNKDNLQETYVDIFKSMRSKFVASEPVNQCNFNSVETVLNNVITEVDRITGESGVTPEEYKMFINDGQINAHASIELQNQMLDRDSSVIRGFLSKECAPKDTARLDVYNNMMRAMELKAMDYHLKQNAESCNVDTLEIKVPGLKELPKGYSFSQMKSRIDRVLLEFSKENDMSPRNFDVFHIKCAHTEFLKNIYDYDYDFELQAMVSGDKTISIGDCPNACALKHHKVFMFYLLNRLTKLSSLLNQKNEYYFQSFEPSIIYIMGDILSYYGYYPCEAMCKQGLMYDSMFNLRNDLNYKEKFSIMIDKLTSNLKDLAKDFYKLISKIANPIIRFFAQHGSVLIKMFAVVTAGYMAYRSLMSPDVAFSGVAGARADAFNTSMNLLSNPYMSQSDFSSNGSQPLATVQGKNNVVSKRGSVKFNKPGKLSRNAARKQSRRTGSLNSESRGISDLENMLLKNVIGIRYGCRVCNATAICSNIAVTAGHFIEQLTLDYEKDKDMTLEIFRENNDPTFVRFDSLLIDYPQDSSLAIIEFPNSYPRFKSIVKHIATEKDQTYLAPHNARLFEKNLRSSIIHNLSYLTMHPAIAVKGVDGAEGFSLDACFKYPFSRSGACGSPIVSVYPKFRIVGIHVAGNGLVNRPEGYCEPIVKESFDDLLEDIKVESSTEYLCLDKPNVDIKGQFLIQGVIPGDKTVRLNDRTSYAKSPLHGLVDSKGQSVFGESNYEPSILNKNDSRYLFKSVSPLEAAIEKGGRQPIPFPEDLLDKAAENLLEKLISTCKPVLQGQDAIMSDQMVFAGIAGVKSAKAIELHTSAGLPYLNVKGAEDKGKEWLFKYHMEGEQKVLDGFHDLFQQQVVRKDRLRKEGVIPEMIINSSLKDCIMSKEKVRKLAGTRKFSVVPCDVNWMFKKYFGWFQNALIEGRIENEVCVGISADSPEWTALFRKLCSMKGKGDINLVTGDYKCFGDTLSYDCILKVIEIIIKWYEYYFDIDEKHANYMRMLGLELINATYQAGNVHYKQVAGIPSGFQLTVELNSLVNCLYMRMAWLDAGIPLKYFDTNFVNETYGDDQIGAVSDAFKDRFNFQVICNFLDRHNIVFTNSSKNVDDNRLFLPLEEATFLKRNFVKHPTREYILGQLPKSSVLESLFWFKPCKSKDDYLCLAENCRSVLNNAYAHGPVFYNEIRNKLMKYFRDTPIGHFHCDQWYEIDDRCFNNN